MNFTAFFVGQPCSQWENNKCYNLTIINNSMIVVQKDTNIRKVYKSLSDFLKDFNAIVIHK